jgi:hypothetical protein
MCDHAQRFCFDGSVLRKGIVTARDYLQRLKPLFDGLVSLGLKPQPPKEKTTIQKMKRARS